MIYRKAYKNFKKFYKNGLEISAHDYFDHFLIQKKSKKLFKYSFLNFLLLFLNYFTIFKCKIKKINKIHYSIIYNYSLKDPRSINFLKKANNKNYINLIRVNNFFLAIRIFFKFKNVIFYNSLFLFYQNIHEKHFLKKIHHRNIYKTYILEKLLKFLNIKKFLTIDDYREMQIFIKSCNKLNIKIIGYQHSRFNKFRVALSQLTFDNYIVWTPFFKKSIIDINKNYQNKVIINNFRNFKKISIKNKLPNIFFFEDDNLNQEKVINFFKKILNLNKYKIFYKKKLNSKNSYKKLNFFLQKKNILVLEDINLYNLTRKYKPTFFMATNSNILLDSYLYDTIPVLLKTANDYSYDLIKHKIVNSLSLRENFNIKLKKLSDQNKKFNKLKKKIWSFKNQKYDKLL